MRTRILTREDPSDRHAIGFCFASHRLNKWHRFSWSTPEWRKVKSKQSQSTFDAQSNIALSFFTWHSFFTSATSAVSASMRASIRPRSWARDDPGDNKQHKALTQNQLFKKIQTFPLPCWASSSLHSFLSVLRPSMTDTWARIWAVNLALS